MVAAERNGVVSLERLEDVRQAGRAQIPFVYVIHELCETDFAIAGFLGRRYDYRN